MAQSGLGQVALPDSLREVIGARVGPLGDRAGRVLSVAAVMGRDFDLELLARATDTPEDDLLDLLDAASAASLVRELLDTPGRYNLRPRPHPAHPVGGPRADPAGPHPPERGRGTRGPLR